MQLLSLLKELSLHPKNADELKDLILQLAVQGKLTVNWRNSQPKTTSLISVLDLIKKERHTLVQEKKIKKETELPPINNDDIPFELPETWLWVRWVDLLGLVQYPMKRGPFGSALRKDFFVEKGVKVFEQYNAINNDPDWCRYRITEDKYKELEAFTAVPGDMLISCSGTLGRICILPEGTEIGIINQALLKIRLENRLINNDYFIKLFRSHYLQSLVYTSAMGSAITNMVGVKELKQFLMPLPPIEEQKAIVEVVNQLFAEVEQLEELTKARISLKEDFITSALRRLTETQNTASEWNWLKDQFSTFFTERRGIKKLRETILQLAVQGKLTAKWREDNPNIEPASELLKRIEAEKQQLIAEKKIKKENPLPAIGEKDRQYVLPDTWQWTRFAQIVVNRDGERKPITKSDRVKGDYDYYGASGVIDKVKDYIFEDNLLLIGEDGANLINRSTPIAFFARGKYWVNNHAHVLDSPFMEVLEYLEVYINGISLVDYITGMAQPKMPQKRMNIIPVPLPPIEEQKAIVEKVNSLMGLCDELEQQIETSHIQVEQLMQSCLKEVFEDKKELVKH